MSDLLTDVMVTALLVRHVGRKRALELGREAVYTAADMEYRQSLRY